MLHNYNFLCSLLHRFITITKIIISNMATSGFTVINVILTTFHSDYQDTNFLLMYYISTHCYMKLSISNKCMCWIGSIINQTWKGHDFKFMRPHNKMTLLIPSVKYFSKCNIGTLPTIRMSFIFPNSGRSSICLPQRTKSLKWYSSP